MISYRVCFDMCGAFAEIGGAGVCSGIVWMLGMEVEECAAGAVSLLCPKTRIAGLNKRKTTREDGPRRRSIYHPRPDLVDYNAAGNSKSHRVRYVLNSSGKGKVRGLRS